MKIISLENYYLPDDLIQYFDKLDPEKGTVKVLTEKDFLELTSTISLNKNVDNKIKELFEISIALYVYGYLYWSFFTLAQEQALKTLEAAVSLIHGKKCGGNYTSEGRHFSFSDMIKRLIRDQVINHGKKQKYWALRQMRNFSFHASEQAQLGFTSFDVIKRISEEINYLFDQLELTEKQQDE
ncbi:TDG/mug DNA glycosylase family protein [Paenibacillus anaericanus]|uniref:hypothetical protein n=1 Tax=Paenibacillus anaericanus TaxID=170367 RepID=UPI0027815AAA|nr:hypothetical protein [Paenibacillus anaericanus]MDQ0091078.1 TDG/mug DNA glycosylase family protein [Paenibacillus anaericanus]